MTIDDTEDDVVSEMPEYSPKSEFSKAELVEQAVMKCIEARSQEMKPGYFNTIINKDGLIQKQWIPDARDKFISSVEALSGLLSPEIKRDKTYLKIEAQLLNDYETITDAYSYEERKVEVVNGQVKYTKTGKKFMPAMDAIVIKERIDMRTKKVIGEPVLGGWNEVLNAYKNELIVLYDKLFAALNDLIDRLNYFKNPSSF